MGLAVIEFLESQYPEAISRRYGTAPTSEGEGISAVEMLSRIAEAKNCRKQGNELDLDRMAMMVVDDFRSGRLGRVSVERPEAGKETVEKSETGAETKDA